MKWNGRLPESELELMLAVWEAGEEGTTAPGILARLERPLTASALHSYLKRLEEKGFLSCGKEGKTNRYRARVSRAEYEQQESRTVLDRLYAVSYTHLDVYKRQSLSRSMTGLTASISA